MPTPDIILCYMKLAHNIWLIILLANLSFWVRSQTFEEHNDVSDDVLPS